MRTLDKSTLARWQALEASIVLCRLADRVKNEGSFKPTTACSTDRVHARVAGGEWEFLLTGPKWFYTRAGKGGGGAVDLVVHLRQLPFTRAAELLKESGLQGAACA
jgi:hypothetical protein